FFLSMPVVAFNVTNIALTLNPFLRPNRPLARPLILAATAAQYFTMTYGIVTERSRMANIIDTTPEENYVFMPPQMVLTLGFRCVF
ncbi:phosphoethanolamine transferase domain-containing protein, partial [Escherichia coli]|uniref:phosphoethanolamine transferase domain-containing protein n=1 Tax=Escherichia coli TaxID=562 RepID=UPI003F9F0A8F